jgi:dephospho-CoA kinase
MRVASALRVGLTGGIASGKSTAADLFASLGVSVIDADQIAREVVLPGTDLLQQVAERFGREVLAPDGSLDRRALRRRVFADRDERAALEQLLHPAIRARMETLSATAAGPYQVHVVPLLVETGAMARYERILVVDCAEAVQIARLTARDGITPEEARATLATQSSRATRVAAADDIIDNSGPETDLRPQVEALHRRYLALAAAAP